MIILRKLDLKSLCRMSRVNKRFNNLAQDHQLYTSLDIDCSAINANKALDYLAPRCEYLRRLDFSPCMSNYVQDFEKFLVIRGSLLTHLRLSTPSILFCSSINNITIMKISRICKNLKELDLRYCDLVQDKGFSYLENLEFLEYLNLTNTNIETETLCKILRRNIQMRHLCLAGTTYRLDVNKVIMELRNSCPDLESIDLWKMDTLTSQSIDALADCKNLRKLICWRTDIVKDHGDSFFRLFSSCQYLERVSLGLVSNLSERDLRGLTLCKNLKELTLTIPLSVEISHEIFVNCPKLEMIGPD
ncbi:F-box/LRR-repeat protein 4 [Trachymyrmex cornetzi]|uniref:F-box/LRR-repeat protein 4 n=2 Tax=Trachymyrmex cornetzi TaxID=471704 RepID=A0A151JRP6_9HYME|nr:F-box/LRR-repeat protein 4 [Trachymyrmex cornetzi]